MSMFNTRRIATLLAIGGLLVLGLIGLAGNPTLAAPSADKGGGGSYAATPLDMTIPGSPLQVIVRPSGSYSVHRNNVQQFYGGYAEGVYLWVNGQVWGPEAVPAGNSVNQYTPVSSVLSGSGSRGDPWVVTNVLTVGATGLQLTQRVSYVNGDEYIRNDWALCVTSGAGYSNVHLFHAADLYTGGSDHGYGYYDPATGAIGGYTQARDLYQIFIPITGGSRYEEDGYSTVWDDIGSTSGPGGGFRNFYRPNDYIDNGAGLEYIFNLTTGCNTISDFVSFSSHPIIPGQTPTPVVRVRNVANVIVSLLQDPDKTLAPGQIFTYTILAKNAGTGHASDASVRIALDPNIEVLDFVSDGSNGFVDYVGDDAVSVVLGDAVNDPNGAKAMLIARVRPTAPLNTKITSRAMASWADNLPHRTKLSNAITVTVGTTTSDSGKHGLQQPLLTLPAGSVPAGTLVLVGGDFFGQDERVSIWVNLPDNTVVGFDDTEYELADVDGIVTFALGTNGAPSGTYSVVAHGLSTGVEGVGVFTVK